MPDGLAQCSQCPNKGANPPGRPNWTLFKGILFYSTTRLRKRARTAAINAVTRVLQRSCCPVLTSIRFGQTLASIILTTDGYTSSTLWINPKIKQSTLDSGFLMLQELLGCFLPDTSDGKFLHPVVLAIVALENTNRMVVSSIDINNEKL